MADINNEGKDFEEFEEFDDFVSTKGPWERLKSFCGNAWAWIKKNKEIVGMGIFGFFGLLVGVADSAAKGERRKNNHEKTYRSIYDRKHGNYVISKKDIKPSQQKVINKRVDAGESIYDVCEDLGIKLKR